MILCSCHPISDRQVKQLAQLGADTVGAIGRATKAGTCCGACVPSLVQCLRQVRTADRTADRADIPLAAK